jgi:putative ABC transport system permease protein
MKATLIKIAFRNFRRNPVYPVTSLICLVLGVSITILVSVYLKQELSYDRFHKHAASIYRVANEFKTPNDGLKGAAVRIPVGSALKERFPEIESMVRLCARSNGLMFYPKDIATPAKNVFYCDTSFFTVFSFELLSGNPQTCLSAGNSMVITDKTAKLWFGNDNPIGKMVRTNQEITFNITGVVKDPPANSQIQFSALLPITIITNNKSLYLQWDGGPSAFTYLLLKPGANPDELEKKFVPLLWEKVNKEFSKAGWSERFYLQPLTDIHLNSDTDNDIHPKGNKSALLILLAVALAILFLGCINFFNLSTLQTISRIKDVAVRKVNGASIASISAKFVIETCIISTLSVLLGIALAEISLPFFNRMTGVQTEINYNLFTVALCLSLAIFPGVLTGLFTAMRFSNVNTISILKKGNSRQGKPLLRDMLVITQFVVTIALITCTLLMTKQVDFLLNKDLGYHKKNIAAIPLTNTLGKKAYVFRDEVMKVAGIRKASLTTAVPGQGYTSNGYKPEGKDVMMINALGVDENFFETMRIPIISGNAFKDNEPADHLVFVINESLERQLGWENPLGKTIERNGQKQIITGICKDFNFAPLHFKIEPLVIDPISVSDGGGYSYLLVSFETADLSIALAQISKIWKKEDPSEPFNSFFLDEQFAFIYSKEIRQKGLLMVFSVLAIIIASLGLFSISLYALSVRTKEIGIRKVNGASTSEILRLITSSFVRWIVLAFIIATPVTWYFMKRWLESFAYKTDISWWVFLIAGMVVLLIALITVSWQAYRAASRNPVEGLRYE